MLQSLASAPSDDETSVAEDDAAAAEALIVYGRGQSASAEQVRAELNLD